MPSFTGSASHDTSCWTSAEAATDLVHFNANDPFLHPENYQQGKRLRTGRCTFSLPPSLTLVVFPLSLRVFLRITTLLVLLVLLLELQAVQPVHVEDLSPPSSPIPPPVARLVGDRVIFQLCVKAQQVVQQKVTFILILGRRGFSLDLLLISGQRKSN